MKALAYSFYGLNDSVQRLVGSLLPIALLLGRLYVAWVFFKAGLTKIDDWGTTLFLFEEEYSVPLLSPEFAAFLATFGELVFPGVAGSLVCFLWCLRWVCSSSTLLQSSVLKRLHQRQSYITWSGA